MEALHSRLRHTARPAYLRAPVSRTVLPQEQPAVAPDEGVSRAAGGAVLRRRAAGGAGASLGAPGSLQAELTDELCDMAGELKRNAYAMGEGVRESLAVLGRVEGSLESNVAAAQRAAQRATELHQVNRASCWHTCAVLSAVLVLTCWMAVIIFSHRDRLSPSLKKMEF